ncbi:MAG: Rrf2 family transcriptional regulator [Candidatus Marinimicrobia bacterium]|nr:Rrf2 family transcriptional regulator [Candidatus Neomarinimicrobiota bacterium]
MKSLINISEGASLALHSLALMAARKPEKMNVKTLADRLDASKAHLAKVLQKLSKAGLVQSFRGPTGGFTLNRAPEDVALLEIYEVIEGKVNLTECPVGLDECMFSECIFNDSLTKISREIYETLKNIKLSEFSKELEK